MRYFLALLLLSTPSLAATDSFSLSQPDKQKHFYGASAGTLVGSLVVKEVGATTLESILITSAAVMTAGLVKEATDSRFSGGDMAANGLGVMAGSVAAAIVIEI